MSRFSSSFVLLGMATSVIARNLKPKVTKLNFQRAGQARLACDMSGEVKPFSVGTYREDSGGSCAVGLEGIPMLNDMEPLLQPPSWWK